MMEDTKEDHAGDEVVLTLGRSMHLALAEAAHSAATSRVTSRVASPTRANLVRSDVEVCGVPVCVHVHVPVC
jgi:hypothetical protein